jgi:predicted phosphodiesterase
MSCPAANVFRQAAELIANDPLREGNLVRLGSPGAVIIAGDVHGNRNNLAKIISHASAGGENKPILVLQEIIHGPVDQRSGCDRSVELMLRAARLKTTHPDKVYFLMGNHDLAQVTGNEITKVGRGVCKSFVQGVNHCFGDDGPDVLAAVLEYCRSLPLAIRFDNGVLASHTLPSPKNVELAGVEVLTRPYREGDFCRGGPAYEWTWGRDQPPEQLDALAEQLGVEFFVLGHRHIESGMKMIPNRGVAINSDGPHGCVFVFDTNEPIAPDQVERYIRKIVTL